MLWFVYGVTLVLVGTWVFVGTLLVASDLLRVVDESTQLRPSDDVSRSLNMLNDEYYT